MHNLNHQQQQLVDQLLQTWRNDGVWPPKNRLHVRYFKDGLVLDELLESLPPGSSRLVEDQRIALTIVGIELASDGSREVKPFLHLVRLAVDTFVADPRGSPTVGIQDLLRFLRAERSPEIDRLGHLYRWEWSLAGSDNEGNWHWRVGMSDVRLEGVKTAADFYRLQRASPRYNLEGLEDGHLKLLRKIYSTWHNSGEWPETVDIVVGERHLGDVLTLLEEVPEDLLCSTTHGGRVGERYRLTLEGVALVAPDEEPEVLVRILGVIRKHHLETEGEGQLSAEEIARILHIEASEVRRVGELFGHGSVGVRIDTFGGSWTARADNKVLLWEGVDSYPAFTRRLAQLQAVATVGYSNETLFEEPDDDLAMSSEASVPMQSTFISYGHPDEAFARKLHEALRANGVVTFFFPEHAEPGKKLHKVMRQVNDFDRVILVCSRASLGRLGVENEIEQTLARESREGGGSRLIPVTLDDHVFAEWKPKNGERAEEIRSRVIADFRGADTDNDKFDAAFARLMTALEIKANGL